jgi:hypothetical protein
MTLDNLVGRGLEKAQADREELTRYLGRIRRKLADSRQRSISLDSRFDVVFEALLQIALAALRANGYRTTSGAGHQQLAIQALPKTIGVPAGAVRTLDEFRKRRSAGLYLAEFEPSAAEVEALVAAADRLQKTLLAWLKAHRPELLEKPPAPGSGQ